MRSKDRPTRNTDKQYATDFQRVRYSYELEGVTYESEQAGEIANETMWGAVEINEDGDALVVRLIGSPVYRYRLADFHEV